MSLTSPSAPDLRPSPAPPAGDVLDSATLDNLSQLDPGGTGHLVQRVLRTYRQSLVRLQDQLLLARAQHDNVALRLAVHTLKSSSASIGALALSELCAGTERALRESRFDEAEGLCETLLAETFRVDDAVRRWLAD